MPIPVPPTRVDAKPRRSEGLTPTSTASTVHTSNPTRPRSPAINAPGSASRQRAVSAKPRASTPHTDAMHASTGGGGSSSDAGAGAGKKDKEKKPRKKGWKGYAMQYFDDDGNLVEERMRDETPPEEKAEREEAQQNLQDQNAEVKDGSSALSPEGSTSRGEVRSDPVKSSKRANKSLSPALLQPPAARVTTQPGSKPIPSSAQPGTSEVDTPPSKPDGARPTAERGRDRVPPKKRRKTSLSVTPQPSDIQATSSAPRPAASGTAAAKDKGKARSSLPSAFAMTARQLGIAANNAAVQAARDAKEAKEAASARATPYIVEDDTPLPKVPRKGMGDDCPVPPESDLRGEAAFIIREAEKHRLEMASMEKHQSVKAVPGHPASPPLTAGEDEIYPQSLRVALHNGEQPTSYQTPLATANGFHQYLSRPNLAAGPSATKRRSDYMTDEDFDRQFAALQQLYSDQERHIMPVFVDDPRPPKFFPGQRPTIILAPGHGRNVGRVRDKHERAYLEGYDGLPEDYEREIVGFIENVRSNMKTVVQFYFDHSTLRRDAFIERLGRELSILGAELTDDGEAAILPHRPPTLHMAGSN